MSTPFTDKFVFSIGGSLIVTKAGIDTDFLSKLNKFIRSQLMQYPKRQFFLISGGGMTCRNYQNAARMIIGHKLPEIDIDWLGVHTTRLNGHLLRTIFYDIAHPRIIENYDHKLEDVLERVIIGAGWKPGWSTDYDAVQICEDYQVNQIVNLSNISYVYDKDPNKFSDAKPIKKMGWKAMRQLVGDKWHPGMNAPFDPIAAKKAQKIDVTVAVLNGEDFLNVENYINGEKFIGTVIS